MYQINVRVGYHDKLFLTNNFVTIKSDGIPTWYREQITPNDGNQFMVSGDVNRKRKPFPENNNKYKTVLIGREAASINNFLTN